MSEQHKLQTAWQLAMDVQQLHDRHMLNLNIKPSTVLHWADIRVLILDSLRESFYTIDKFIITFGTDTASEGIPQHMCINMLEQIVIL